MYFCSNQLANFKFKYYDHDPTLCRILKTNPVNFEYLKCDEPFYVNFICCSIHYSNRFSTGDLFLEDRTNQSLRQEVMWMKETRKEDVLQDFIQTYLQRSETHIHEKDVLFLWKMYMKEKNYINIFQKEHPSGFVSISFVSVALFYEHHQYENALRQEIYSFLEQIHVRRQDRETARAYGNLFSFYGSQSKIYRYE